MLNDKYQRIMDAKMADPSATWEDLAKKAKISARQLRRVRNSDEWKDEWKSRDKEVMLGSMRQKALDNDNAALFTGYLKAAGHLDTKDAFEFLRMSEEEAVRIANDAKEWLNAELPEGPAAT